MKYNGTSRGNLNGYENVPQRRELKGKLIQDTKDGRSTDYHSTKKKKSEVDVSYIVHYLSCG